MQRESAEPTAKPDRMPRLQDFDTPLVFKVVDGSPARSDEVRSLRRAFQVDVRSLEGMQKEVLVRQVEPAGPTWRMACDEGPYLNGTDLAPFPLAYFAAGLHFCYMSQLLRLCRRRGVTLRALSTGQDTKYTMTGSALRGDMTGSGVPVTLDVALDADVPLEVAADLVSRALAQSPGHSVMRDLFTNTFALQLNGHPLDVGSQMAASAGALADPLPGFAGVTPAADEQYRPEIIVKTETIEAQHGVAGGAGSSLKSEQKRTLHVRSDARLVGGDLLETDIRLFQPLGSSFRFLADVGIGDTTPPPLAYLSAGIGFCYMTQLGRYAHITKQKVTSTRIVQQNTYTQPVAEGAVAEAAPVDTQVFIDADERDDVARKSVRMGEQTCFLHGSMRAAFPTTIRATLNGSPVPLPAASDRA